MPLVLEANYSKKIGLPGYSSHQFSLTIRTELSDIKQVEAETARLYALLQSSVDREIQEIGFLPNDSQPATNGNGHPGGNGNGHHRANGSGDIWACTDKQKQLILKIVEDNRLDKNEVEQLAKERFGFPVKALNKMQASNLIDELLATYGNKQSESSNGHRRYTKGARQ